MTALPDGSGHFGRYGGRFVPEALVAALDELTAAYAAARADASFGAELDTPAEIIYAADQALYAAKARGKNCIEAYEPKRRKKADAATPAPEEGGGGGGD